MTMLREVLEAEDLVHLRDKMIPYLPYSAYISGFLHVLINCQMEENLTPKIYIPEGPKSSSLVVVTPTCSQEAVQSMSVFWNADEEDDDQILRLLKSLPNWDWSAPVLCRGILISLCNKLQKFVVTQRLSNKPMWCRKTFQGSLYELDRPNLQFVLPDGYYLDMVHPEDLPTVISPWSNWSESLKGVRALVANLPSVAIRCHKDTVPETEDPLKCQQGDPGKFQAKDSLISHAKNLPTSHAENPHRSRTMDPQNSRLVSWSLLFKHGFFANTFTIPEFRRRGLASATTLAMAQKLRRLNLPVRLLIHESNSISVVYHEKLGFEKKCDVESFAVLPKDRKLEDYITQCCQTV